MNCKAKVTRLGDAVDLILDGGPTTVGIESTVLPLADQRPCLLGPGMVSQREIEALIQGGWRTARARHRVLHPKHCSPATRLALAEGGRLPERGRALRRLAPA